MLQIERIQVEDLCALWNQRFSSEVLAGKSDRLAELLALRGSMYLPPRSINCFADVRRDRNEYGFSNLRLVVAFMRWHNLKENPDERINTPFVVVAGGTD